jgi:hypothetical protein
VTADTGVPSAWYASRRGGLTQWWTVLHPPYTLWHLSYVVLGGAIAPHLDVGMLLATLLAFALAVGLAAHALDELQGRPLHTTLSSAALMAVAVASLGGAVALGFLGLSRISPVFVVFIVVGVVLVVVYNLELFGGVLHNSAGFALAWGAFPALTAYFVQTGRLSLAAVLVASAAFGLSLVQRTLSTPARRLRRRTVRVGGSLTFADGSVQSVDRTTLLEPLETSLRVLSWTTVVLAAGVAFGHLG